MTNFDLVKLSEIISYVSGYVYNTGFSDASRDEPYYIKHEELMSEVKEAVQEHFGITINDKINYCLC